MKKFILTLLFLGIVVNCFAQVSLSKVSEKEVYKTSMEIDQRWVIDLAADRQNYIDQAQSLNLFFRPDAHIKYVHAIHFMAWKKGLKTLYYCRSEKIGKADKVSKKIERQVIKELDMTQIAQGNDCIACIKLYLYAIFQYADVISLPSSGWRLKNL